MARDHVELGAQPGLTGTDGWSVLSRLGHRAFHMPADPAHRECPSNLLLYGPEPKCRPDDSRTTTQPAERGHFRHLDRDRWPWLKEKVNVLETTRSGSATCVSAQAVLLLYMQESEETR